MSQTIQVNVMLGDFTFCREELEVDHEEMVNLIQSEVRRALKAEVAKVTREAIASFTGELRVALSNIFQKKIMDLRDDAVEDKLFEAMIEGRI